MPVGQQFDIVTLCNPTTPIESPSKSHAKASSANDVITGWPPQAPLNGDMPIAIAGLGPQRPRDWHMPPGESQRLHNPPQLLRRSFFLTGKRFARASNLGEVLQGIKAVGR